MEVAEWSGRAFGDVDAKLLPGTSSAVTAAARSICGSGGFAGLDDGEMVHDRELQ